MILSGDHFVPQFILKNFVDGDGKIFSLSKKSGERLKRPPKYTAFKANLSFTSGSGSSRDLEEYFSKIEARASVLVRSMISEGTLSCLKGRGIVDWARFVVIQAIRTPAFLLSPKISTSGEVPGDRMKEIINQLDGAIDIVSRRSWILLSPIGRKSFYIGDNPLCFEKTEDPGSGGSIGFDVSGVEAYFPISPQFCMYTPCVTTVQKIRKELDDVYRALTMITLRPELEGEVGFKKVDLLEESKTQREYGGDFLDSLETGKLLSADDEIVAKSNSLEVAYAGETILSHNGDFEFAEKVLKNSPSYRETPKGSLSRGFYLKKDGVENG